MRPALLAVVLALCVVTAGCSSLFDSDDPPPNPETTTLSGELTPGLSAEGFTDRSELTNAHIRIFLEESFTIRRRVVERANDGTVRGRLESTTRIGSNHSHYFIRSTRNGSLAPKRDHYEFAAWSNGRLSLMARTIDHRTYYWRSRNPDELLIGGAEATTNHDRLYVLFTAMNVTHVDRIETNDTDTPTYRVVANDLVYPVSLTNSGGFDSVENVSLVAVIDTWGMVHRYRFEVTVTIDGETVHRMETFEVTNAGVTTISRPLWYSAAMENTSKR
ncbi:DUF7537 family lipoprotein [Haladaptatus sp. NG-SE-30]